MSPDPASVNRLGFAAWADNLIVDALEGIDTTCSGSSTTDTGSCFLRIVVDGRQAACMVRAYVDGLGWQQHERVVSL